MQQIITFFQHILFFITTMETSIIKQTRTNSLIVSPSNSGKL